MENSLLSGTHEQFMQILRIIGLCVFEKKKNKPQQLVPFVPLKQNHRTCSS